MNRAGLILSAAAGAALVLSSPRSSASARASSPEPVPPVASYPYTDPLDFGIPTFDYGVDFSPGPTDPIYSPEEIPMMNTPPIEYFNDPEPPHDPGPVINDARNLDAFLAVIRAGESSDSYTRLVGGGDFQSFEDHPFETGEFAGIRRKDDGRLTTAAGAYQITVTTWRSLGGKAKYGSFAPSAQDQAAIDLLKRRGAYADVLAGRIIEAHGKLRQEWEIFTRNNWRADRVAERFVNEGGALA